jgi:hypothetical protein
MIVMPPRKTSRKATTPKSRPRKGSKTRALAISDPVRRQSLRTPSFLDRQQAFLQHAATWSPLGLLVAQQAAFWEGLAGVLSVKATPSKRRARSTRRSR